MKWRIRGFVSWCYEQVITLDCLCCKKNKISMYLHFTLHTKIKSNIGTQGYHTLVTLLGKHSLLSFDVVTIIYMVGSLVDTEKTPKSTIMKFAHARV